MGDDSVRTILTRLGPGVIGVAAFQINVLSPTASDFLPASMWWLRRLRRAPVGIASGIICCLDGDVSTADPRGWRLKKYDDFRGQLDEATRHLLFVNLPAAALLFVLAEPIVLLFQYANLLKPPRNARRGHCVV